MNKYTQDDIQAIRDAAYERIQRERAELGLSGEPPFTLGVVRVVLEVAAEYAPPQPAPVPPDAQTTSGDDER